MNTTIHVGKCGICNSPGVELTEHHVVEYLDKEGRTPKIDLCRDCHDAHERYRNYLRDECDINIDQRKNSD